MGCFHQGMMLLLCVLRDRRHTDRCFNKPIPDAMCLVSGWTGLPHASTIWTVTMSATVTWRGCVCVVSLEYSHHVTNVAFIDCVSCFLEAGWLHGLMITYKLVLTLWFDPRYASGSHPCGPILISLVKVRPGRCSFNRNRGRDHEVSLSLVTPNNRDFVSGLSLSPTKGL